MELFEVYDGVFVAVELLLVKERAGTVQQAGEDELRIFPNALPVAAGEEGGRAGTIKALVVIENPNFQSLSLKVLDLNIVLATPGFRALSQTESSWSRNDIPEKSRQGRKAEPAST